MQPGHLDQFIVIRDPLFTKSASGEDIRDLTGAPFASAWAAVEEPRASKRTREVYEAMRDTSEHWFDFTIRRIPGIRTSMWIEWTSFLHGALVLDIRFVEGRDRAAYIKLT